MSRATRPTTTARSRSTPTTRPSSATSAFGAPAAREYVAATLDRIVTETGAEWIKLDFNVDPDSGCTRTDHGHGAGDGLLRHYEGLYAVLDAFRERHPEVVLEACSSGGWRIDLGLARHVHCLFLSDPDYTEHHLAGALGGEPHAPAGGDAALVVVAVAAAITSRRSSTSRASPATSSTRSCVRRCCSGSGSRMRLPELSADQLDAIRNARRAVHRHGRTVRAGRNPSSAHRAQPLRAGEGERARRRSSSASAIGTWSPPSCYPAARLRMRCSPVGAKAGSRVTDLATGAIVPAGRRPASHSRPASDLLALYLLEP